MFTNQLPLLTPLTGIINIDQPSRTKLVGYPGRMMLRDIKRRKLATDYLNAPASQGINKRHTYTMNNFITRCHI
ncbi:unnamed protein product [Rotaria sp. Silwood1]|nr:unnamed protein product [Rotaria sp. Silwood1]